MGKIYKSLIYDNEISVALLDTTDVVNTAIKYHNLSPVTAASLGRTLTIVSFMTTSLKNDGNTVTVTINGNGLGGHIVACGESDNSVRGYIDNPQLDIPYKPNGKLDVSACVGNEGRITIVKNLGLKEPYVGTSKIVSGEIVEDFVSYYAYSEQQPTAMAVGVKIGVDYSCVGAGGLILQPMPNAKEENIVKAEKLIEEFSQISSLIEEIGVKGIIEKYFNGVEFNVYDTEYKCTCSRERIDKILITLGENELYETIEKEGKIEVDCHFCPEKYVYLKKDIDCLLRKNGQY